MAAPNYRHGKYSKYLPTKIAADYEAAISDPEIHALTHEIGVIEARYRTLLRRSESSDLGHAWLTLEEVWQAFLEAPEAEKWATRQAVEKTIKRGKQDYLLWQTIQETTKLLSGLRVQEHKRIVDLQLVMTEQQMVEALGYIQRSLYEAVMARVEKDVGRAILADVQQKVARFLPPVQAPQKPAAG